MTGTTTCPPASREGGVTATGHSRGNPITSELPAGSGGSFESHLSGLSEEVSPDSETEKTPASTPSRRSAKTSGTDSQTTAPAVLASLMMPPAPQPVPPPCPSMGGSDTPGVATAAGQQVSEAGAFVSKITTFATGARSGSTQKDTLSTNSIPREADASSLTNLASWAVADSSHLAAEPNLPAQATAQTPLPTAVFDTSLLPTRNETTTQPLPRPSADAPAASSSAVQGETVAKTLLQLPAEFPATAQIPVQSAVVTEALARSSVEISIKHEDITSGDTPHVDEVRNNPTVPDLLEADPSRATSQTVGRMDTKPAARIPSPAGGTAVALYADQMSAKQILPQSESGDGSELPVEHVIFSRHLPLERESETMIGEPASHLWQSLLKTDLVPVHDSNTHMDASARAVSLERLERLVGEEIRVFRTEQSQHLDVVLRPSADMEVSLQLRQTGNGLEALMRCDSTHTAMLLGGWDALKHDLAAQGVRLLPLETAPGNTFPGAQSSGAGLSQQQSGSQQRLQEAAGSPASASTSFFSRSNIPSRAKAAETVNPDALLDRWA